MALLPCLPPVRSPKRPSVLTPTGACDTHFHIFGPSERFPFAETRSYTPEDAPLERVLEMHAVLGIERGVTVQGNAHGTDNSAMIDAVKRSAGRLRGVGIVPADTPAAEIRRMADAGVCALRFHHIAGDMKATFSPLGVDAFLKLAPLMAELDLHVQIMMDASELPAVMPRLKEWKRPIVLDHYALAPASEGVGGAGFQAVCRYLSEGRIWVKLSGAYRISDRYPDYDDVQPMHEALVNANPDQVLWGSDWPHPRLAENMPDDGHLLDLFNAWTPDTALRRKILVTNPAKLYRFA
ncbi:MAG TPA: amidohydrolase family protein [Burkholderiales bacterium]|nr:amidohydrolase family protein [Burkholderiales bacterium]